jgi:hypothetical protein
MNRPTSSGTAQASGAVLSTFSEDGAAIELRDAALATAEFMLLLERDRTTRRCRLVWSSDNRVGVIFRQDI